MSLNEQQIRVVNHDDGPLLVLACPGSGKTRCVTERIARLIENGEKSSAILGVTFTNKAAKEMGERLKQHGHDGVLLCTFHALGVRILRKCGKLLGYKSNFTIVDQSGQLSLLRKVVKSQGFDPKSPQYDPKIIVKHLEDKKNQLTSDEKFELHLDPELVAIFREYGKMLKASNSMDFSDLIYNVVKLFQNNPKICEAYARKYRYILVDEMQDTNKAQLEMVKYLASVHNNIMCVGDVAQCFPAGTKIKTPTGTKCIEDFKKGDKISTLIKPGIIGPSEVTKVITKVSKSIAKIYFDDGSIIECTPNHLIPMDVKLNDDYTIYLMYKRELGFRIGMCKTSRQGWLSGRASQEGADAIWVIDSTSTKSEAFIKEQFYSIKYGLPTIVYHNSGRKMVITEKQIKWLFDNINTVHGGKRLLDDKHLDFSIPHHMPRMNQARKERIILNISLCADRGMHRYSMCTNNKEILEEFGTPRKSKHKNWRIENSTKSAEFIDSFVSKASETFGDRLSIWLSIKADDDKPLRCQPVANLLPGSIVYCEANNKIDRKKVNKIEFVQRSQIVYDLNVFRTHNYFADGVLVHNSIYGWRGACIENIMGFENHFEGAQVTELGISYRCTPEILQAAQSLIAKNRDSKQIKLKAFRESGNKVDFQSHAVPENEAEEVANLINVHKYDGTPFKEMAVLCRTNALTRVFEETFRRRRIPYVLIGAFGFYDRKEVKTAISFMKFLANSEDALSFEEIINTPSRGIGPVTLVKILEHAVEHNRGFLDVCQDIDGVKDITRKVKSSISHFVEILNTYDKNRPHDSLKHIFEESGFLEHLRTTDRAKDEHREDNVQELLRAFNHYATKRANPSLDQYLQEVMLMSSSDKEVDTDSVSLMTCHAAKGLEFDVVFIPGMEEEVFPHKRSLADGSIEEERRVAYVAITRAKDFLHLSMSAMRHAKGNVPSRFLEDMGLIEIDWSQVSET
tara:strand:+ start:14953 stop:17850 length:2898 start_codon:yes stop_codon:yes gene_type:complete